LEFRNLKKVLQAHLIFVRVVLELNSSIISCEMDFYGKYPGSPSKSTFGSEFVETQAKPI